MHSVSKGKQNNTKCHVENYCTIPDIPCNYNPYNSFLQHKLCTSIHLSSLFFSINTSHNLHHFPFGLRHSVSKNHIKPRLIRVKLGGPIWGELSIAYFFLTQSNPTSCLRKAKLLVTWTNKRLY